MVSSPDPDIPDPPRGSHLLNGRRVKVLDLIEAGLLKPGARLVFERKRLEKKHFAEVTAKGRIQLHDGVSYGAPSPAAVAAIGGGAVDGWNAWKLVDTGATLGHLRRELLNRRRDDEGAGAGEPWHETLLSVQQGAQPQMRVREFLRLWPHGERTSSERIRADLDNYEVVTRPDFASVGMDETIRLTRVAQDDPVDEQDDDDAYAHLLDITAPGLKVGKIPSAFLRDELAVVRLTSSLVEAMTLMRLRDFSQVPVFDDADICRGVVTWPSIGKAYASVRTPTLQDAVISPVTHRYDTDLLDTLRDLERYDHFLVTGEAGELVGIVTNADVVHWYDRSAAPFHTLEEIEHLLLRLVEDNWELEDVRRVCGPRVRSLESLTFGNYCRVLEDANFFELLNWPIDQGLLMEVMHEVRDVRNGLMHFKPDSVSEQSMVTMRRLLRLLRELNPAY
jgi:CBS domain-containing protein